MTRPYRVPEEQAARFGLSIAEALKIDPTLFALDGIESGHGERCDLTKVTLVAYLPSQQVIDLFNDAGAPKAPVIVTCMLLGDRAHYGRHEQTDQCVVPLVQSPDSRG